MILLTWNPIAMKVNLPKPPEMTGELSIAILLTLRFTFSGSAAECSPSSKPFEVHHLSAKSTDWSDSRRKIWCCLQNKQQNHNHTVTLGTND